MSRKADNAILTGFTLGGADDPQFENAGNKYRRCTMHIAGKPRTIFKIPGTSHLDARALERKARDMAHRFIKYDTVTLTW